MQSCKEHNYRIDALTVWSLMRLQQSMKRAGSTLPIEQCFAAHVAKPPVSFEPSGVRRDEPSAILRARSEKGVKVVTIPSLYSLSSLPEERFDEIWRGLEAGVGLLFDGGVATVDFAKLYRDAEFFCRFKGAKDLYELILPQMTERTAELVRSVTVDMEARDIAKAVGAFEENLTNLRKIFFYLDRSFVFANRVDGFTSLPELAHDLVRRRLLENHDKVAVIISQIGLQVNLMRCGQGDHRGQLTALVEFVRKLGLYETSVEPLLFEQAEEFFTRVGRDLTLGQFLEWYGAAVRKEEELVECGVKESTVSLIVRIARKVCLEDNADVIFGDEFRSAIESGRCERIEQLYALFDGDDIREIFNERFGGYFAARIGELVEGAHDAEVLIAVFSEAMEFTRNCFSPDSSVVRVVRRAVEKGMGAASSTVARLLAKYFNRGLPVRPEDEEFLWTCRVWGSFEIVCVRLMPERVLQALAWVKKRQLHGIYCDASRTCVWPGRRRGRGPARGNCR